MRKVFAGIAAVLALGAFSTVSAEMSVGGGGFFAGNFGGGVDGEVSVSAGGQSVNMTMDVKMPNVGGGVYGFFDVEYAELSVGLFLGGGAWEVEAKAAGQSNKQKIGDLSTVELDLGLLLKYPVALSGSMTVFPAAGINYQLCTSAKMNDTEADEPGDLSRVWIKFGAGGDFYLSEKLFIRPVLLYGIGLENKMEKDYRDMINSQLQSALGASPNVDTKLSHGLTVKVGVGFKL